MTRYRALSCVLVLLCGTACSVVPPTEVKSPSVIPTIPAKEITIVAPEEVFVPPAAIILPSPITKVDPVVVAIPKPTVAPIPKPVVVAPVKPAPVVIKPVVVVPVPVVVAPIPVVKPVVGYPIKAMPKDWRLKTVPANMLKLSKIVIETTKNMWPDLKAPSFVMAQIEQETCISPTHSKCGSSTAELKTSREYGFGLGQTTIAYAADGSERFNVWKELRVQDPRLRAEWTWENRFDTELQVRAMMVKNRSSWSSIRFDTRNDEERLAFAFVTYNSGSVLSDRRLCEAKSDCDPSSWFTTPTMKGVEAYSNKSDVKANGYGMSFREISREYPWLVMRVRRDKYIPIVDSEGVK